MSILDPVFSAGHLTKRILEFNTDGDREHF